MYNPSKKLSEILSKFLEFDPEQLQVGVWSGDLTLTNVNIRGDALYPKINRTKKSPSGRDPLKLKIIEGTISLLRIQIPWQRLVWGQGDVVIDIKGCNAVVGFESREETEARQAAAASSSSGGVMKKDDIDPNEPVLHSQEFRKAKQKVLAEAEERLMHGQHISHWLANMIKTELSIDETGVATEKKIRKYEKWMQRAGTGMLWKVLSGLKINIEGFKLIVVQDNIEIGIVMPNIHVQKKGNKNDKYEDKSFENKPEPTSFNDIEDGDNIDKTIDATGVSIFARRRLIHPIGDIHPQSMILLPDDYILRPINFSFSLSFFFPHDNEANRKRKANLAAGQANGDVDGSESTVSSKRRRGKRDKLPTKGHVSVDGTAETDLVSSFGPDKQRSPWSQSTDDPLVKSIHSARRINTPPGKQQQQRQAITHQRHRSVGTRSAPLVRPDDLGSVYASVMAENTQLTPKLDLKLNCGEIKLMCSSNHLEIVTNFFAVGARMRNGRPTCTITEVLAKGDKGMHKRNQYSSAMSGSGSGDDHLPAGQLRRGSQSNTPRVRSEFPGRRMSMGIRNDLAAKARIKRSQVIRSWWHYAYGVVAYEIQKRKRRRDNFRAKYVSFDWDKQKQRRKDYINLYLSLELDVGHHVRSDATVLMPEAEDLLRIEDELPVEQILLYRSIARALVLHGMDSMPTSIGVLYMDFASSRGVEQRRDSLMSSEDVSMRISRRLSVHNDITQQNAADNEDDDDNVLSMVARKCKYGRMYRSFLMQDNVMLFDDPCRPQDKVATTGEKEKRRKRNIRASMGLGAMDIVNESEASNGRRETRPDDLGNSKVSFSYDYSEEVNDAPTPKPMSRRKADSSDGRTVRTFKTTKSARTKASAMAGSVLDNIEQSASGDGSRISFSLFFKSVELMLVAAETNMPDAKPASRYSQGSPSTGSSDDVSELSFLSEEDFFREQDSVPVAAAVQEEAEENPMLSSTDFLLFGSPRNLLLHVTLSPVRCSLLGKSRGSKNINFTVGSITASGEGRDSLIAIGSRASPTPVPVVSLSKKFNQSSHDDGGFPRFSSHSTSHGTPGPKEAISFSLIKHEAQKALQVDIAKVHVCIDIPLLVKLIQFPSTSDEGSPKRMLPISAREEARLFILRENPPSKLAGINSSVRIHGIDLSVPVEALPSMPDSDSSDDSGSENFEGRENNAPAVRISAKIIEFYSGTAVSDLCNVESGGAVGALQMLDVSELVSARATLSAYHSVSFVAMFFIFLRVIFNLICSVNAVLVGRCRVWY